MRMVDDKMQSLSEVENVEIRLKSNWERLLRLVLFIILIRTPSCENQRYEYASPSGKRTTSR